MATITVNQQQLNRILKKLNNIATFSQRATVPMEESVKLIFEKMTDQPTKAAGAFTRSATPAQRRAYWAKVGSGEAQHSETSGYIRSGTLKRMWGKKVQKTSRGVIGTVENLAPYGKWVQGSQQQRFHAASKWLTNTKAVDKYRREVLGIWTRWIRKELRD